MDLWTDSCFENLDDLSDNVKGDTLHFAMESHVVPNLKTENSDYTDDDRSPIHELSSSFDFLPLSFQSSPYPSMNITSSVSMNISFDSETIVDLSVLETEAEHQLPVMKEELPSTPPAAYDIPSPQYSSPVPSLSPHPCPVASCALCVAAAKGSVQQPPPSFNIKKETTHNAKSCHPSGSNGRYPCCDMEVPCWKEEVVSSGMVSPPTISLGVIHSNLNNKIGMYTPEARRRRILRFLEKRARRVWDKKISYDCRKKLADTRPRIKGRFVKKEEAKMILDLMSFSGPSHI
eukprot:GILK01000170.1.p1 GENE.GILK01000170.1~~GILK01000170.1.p1  ORF type:complete len:336 (+),score=34.35 GILK01000170.1:139-1008(+)